MFQLNGNTEASPSPRVAEILNAADDVLERTVVLERRLMVLSESLLGPNAYLASADDDPPLGSVNRVAHTIGRINRRLDSVFAELERLERL